jgi:hypothetical protein
VVGTSNLVCYDWEITPARSEGCIYLGQLLRVLFHARQIPSGSAGLAWLQAVSPKLANSATAVSRTDPSTLSFARKASIGLTAIEMHLLADWLESPSFPSGTVTGSTTNGLASSLPN